MSKTAPKGYYPMQINLPGHRATGLYAFPYGVGCTPSSIQQKEVLSARNKSRDAADRTDLRPLALSKKAA